VIGTVRLERMLTAVSRLKSRRRSTTGPIRPP
jgi:hypothetical protein